MPTPDRLEQQEDDPDIHGDQASWMWLCYDLASGTPHDYVTQKVGHVRIVSTFSAQCGISHDHDNHLFRFPDDL